ncbi:Uncharacterized protein APZ42_014137 [Daphnia magna]|uniref:Uncharacterized protein n=1 Tax=Daphnia magna TaxID=35525 RepID=A0A162PZU9_9CRUS|nr:Uncharacterized protein APZ42_014137 [Daphnia magna]
MGVSSRYFFKKQEIESLQRNQRPFGSRWEVDWNYCAAQPRHFPSSPCLLGPYVVHFDVTGAPYRLQTLLNQA